MLPPNQKPRLRRIRHIRPQPIHLCWPARNAGSWKPPDPLRARIASSLCKLLPETRPRRVPSSPPPSDLDTHLLLRLRQPCSPPCRTPPTSCRLCSHPRLSSSKLPCGKDALSASIHASREKRGGELPKARSCFLPQALTGSCRRDVSISRATPVAKAVYPHAAPRASWRHLPTIYLVTHDALARLGRQDLSSHPQRMSGTTHQLVHAR